MSRSTAPKAAASQLSADRLTTDRISQSLASRQSPGLVISLYERVPLQRKINRLLNQYAEAESPLLREHFLSEIKSARQALHESNGDGHSNPDWILSTIDANIKFFTEDFAEALAWHERALALIAFS